MKVSRPIWSILSELNLLKYPSTKALDYRINPKDKNLEKIFKNIVSKDYLRTVLTGINYEGDFATGTDAHKLIHLEGKRIGQFEDGTYKLISKVEKEYEKTFNATISFEKHYKFTAIIEGKYPNYVAITPKFYQFKKTFDLSFLNGIVSGMIKNKLTPAVTKTIAFEFDTNEGKYHIGFNSEFLSDVCESLMMSGQSIVDFYFNEPSKAVIILGQEKKFPKEKEADKFFKENTYCILMPVMIGYNRYYDNKEDDFDEILKSYPLIKYNDTYDFDITIGDSPTYNTLSAGKKVESKQVKKEKSKADLYKQLIEGYELALEMETDKKKIKMYNDLIEGYELSLELE